MISIITLIKGKVVRGMLLRESRGRVHRRGWREEKEKGKTC